MVARYPKNDIMLCMAGTIRVFQKCRCRSTFTRQGREFICSECGAVPTRYVVDVHFRGNRVRIYSDKHGLPLDSLKRAERVLEGIRYEIDNDRFDPARYIAREREEYEFHSRMEKWTADYERKKGRGEISSSYLKEIRRYGGKYFIPFFGNSDLRDIHTKHVKDFSDWLPESLSPKTRKDILDTLNKFFNDMKDLEILEKAPIIPKISVPEPPFNWCDMETQEAILREIPRIHWPIMWFIAKQGVRPSEARALHWEDLDLKNDVVCIRRAFSLNDLRMTTKGKHADWLPLHPEVKRLTLELPRGISGFVFTYKGRHYSESMMRKLWKAACKKLGITGLSLYQGTRHSVASDAVQRGLSLYDVMDALRHKDIRTTMKYSHLEMEGKKRGLLGSKVVEFPKQRRRNEE